jgi:hypothetical protein
MDLTSRDRALGETGRRCLVHLAGPSTVPPCWPAPLHIHLLAAMDAGKAICLSRRRQVSSCPAEV